MSVSSVASTCLVWFLRNALSRPQSA
ncbi:MAG: hypothetical protein ACI91V_000830, partial [Lentimonas sp.]